MEGGIDADVPLDYAEFQIFSSQNRYEACVCFGNKVEPVASGILEQLLLHSIEAKKLYSKGCNANFKIQPPDDLNGAEWFNKSTLTSFLRIVGSPDILNIINGIENEISQLEETRRFQFSLTVKGYQNQFGSGETDRSNSNGMAPTLKAEVDILSSDTSKNELLRAMDLRLTTLRGEIAAAFNQAAGTTCSPKEISDLEKISHHFGAINIRDFLRKFVDLSQKNQSVDFPNDNKSLFMNDSRNGNHSKTEGSTQISKLSHLNTVVKYGVSPAKVAQVERQSSTDSDESSFSSEEDRPSVERSRPLIISASPRRSASPMRRIQIGRSGSRKASTRTFKSLNYLPARERVVSHRDATSNSSEEEGSEQPPKKSENNVQRISVQDAINLFENKQKDQTVDIQKTRSLLNASVSANKSVLRRWSAGMGESSDPMTPNNLAGEEIPRSSHVKPESDLNSGCHGAVETFEVDVKLDSSEKMASNPMGMNVDTLGTQREENSENLTSSAKWSQQKEAELNQLLMKMMESKPVKYHNTMRENSKRENGAGEQRGGFYDHYKQKRDEKLIEEISGKRVEKEAQIRAMQQSLDERKAEMASTNGSDLARKHAVSRPQKAHKNPPQLANPKKEALKPAVVKKASPKASSLPCTRKSWPSTPSPRASSKTPTGTTSVGTTSTRRKPQPASSAPRSSPKVERSQPRPRTVKTTQNDAIKNTKDANEKKHQTVSKSVKTTKTKIQTSGGDSSSTGKPSFYSKMTKKGSVMPLESKPFLRKGSRISPGVGPVVVKTKISSQPGESLRESRDLIQAEENEVITNTFDVVSQQHGRDMEAIEILADPESEIQVISPQKCEDIETSNDFFNELAEPAIENGVEEELFISPMAWVEIEEYEDQSIPGGDNSCHITSPVGMSSQRVRQSLSQMLLEESSEPDIIEWGNAENPPSMIYQQDSPKGLKRLLKFARKSKADAHLTGWSIPSAFSEGEDEVEESRTSKRNADNLLRKAALHAKNCGQQKTTSYETYEKNSAQSNISKFTAQSSHKLQEGHISASATASKATRSFFSLSAFRGSKLNETKLG